MDYEELENLTFPVSVLLIEKLDPNATDADLYNAGYNMIPKTIESLKDVPAGYRIHSIIEDEDEDE